ncbi:MAG TPA: hypothetical protein DDX71_08030 [Ruminococcus sp.]|nr:hypothetical protein [Ruminococcus sp.]
MKKKLKIIFRILFWLSLFYYVFWLLYAVRLFFDGIDSGWAMPAMSNGEKVYGAEAFASGIAIGLLAMEEYFLWWIPLYQAVYLVVCIIRKIISRRKK